MRRYVISRLTANICTLAKHIEYITKYRKSRSAGIMFICRNEIFLSFLRISVFDSSNFITNYYQMRYKVVMIIAPGSLLLTCCSEM